ncbi:MAG: hypothetical protein HQL87_12550 [Magnetococcales bacterium]|nr:hypothetical protein [Magnetococcales bacterium]
MELLNLIPVLFLVWVILVAVKGGKTHDRVDDYFQKQRIQTGRKSRNFFGIPSATL